MARKSNLANHDLVLAETGYRCTVPNCRALHELGAFPLDDSDELVCLCAGCGRRYDQEGVPSTRVMRVYRTRLRELGQAVSRENIDLLFYLSKLEWLAVSGDKVFEAAALLNAGYLYADYKTAPQYRLRLTLKGRQFLDAWQNGEPVDRE